MSQWRNFWLKILNFKSYSRWDPASRPPYGRVRLHRQYLIVGSAQDDSEVKCWNRLFFDMLTARLAFVRRAVCSLVWRARQYSVVNGCSLCLLWTVRLRRGAEQSGFYCIPARLRGGACLFPPKVRFCLPLSSRQALGGRREYQSSVCRIFLIDASNK